jgi:hypothetical protein
VQQQSLFGSLPVGMVADPHGMLLDHATDLRICKIDVHDVH